LAREESAATRDEQFAAFVGRQARFVFRVAYSVLRNVQDADDVVQETFLKLYRSQAWERATDEKAFLARTAWRIVIDQINKGTRHAPPSDSPWVGQNPEQAAISSDWNSAVCRLIDALPEELRQPLALSSVEEMNSREIAEVMGIPEGTVRTRLMRARQILKQKLGALGAGRHEKT
jgi:RNA polymerase sigma-70 factor (ECF subfamily)